MSLCILSVFFDRNIFSSGKFFKGFIGKEKFDFVVSRAVMPLPDLVKLTRKNIKREQKNALPNGIICLKGGELAHEVFSFRHVSTLYDLKDWFDEEFFKTKKAVFVAINNK